MSRGDVDFGSAEVAPLALVSNLDREREQTREGNSTMRVGVMAIETWALETDEPQEAPLADAQEQRGGIFGSLPTRVKRTFSALAMGAVVASPLAACGNDHAEASNKPPAAAASPFPQASKAGGQGGGEVVQTPNSLVDINALTEQEASKLSLDQIRQTVTRLGWAHFSLMEGAALTPDGRAASDFFDAYHNTLTGSTLYPDQETLAQATADQQCAALHLLAYGMDESWYFTRCLRIRAAHTVPLPDDYEVALKDPTDSIMQLPDGSLLSKATIGSSKSVAQRQTAYLLTFETKDRSYYTLRIGPTAYAQLAETANKTP